MQSLLQSRWVAPVVHALLFAFTWLTAFVQPQPILDGPARWGFIVLFFADFPVSVIGFSAMWDHRLILGLSLWGVVGTAWWYFLGVWFQRRRVKKALVA